MAYPDMIGMVVKDMADSLKFYRLLGLEIAAGAESEDFAEVITPNGYRISWNTVTMIKGLYPDWEEPRGQRMTLAFKCADPDEVDALHAAVMAGGYASYKAPWDAFWGQRYAVVIDPDGNLVDLFAALGE
jgi:uncharacterized glyoxalase superfamily protein PhnB